MMNHASSEESWIAFDFWKKMKLLTTSSQVSEILLSLPHIIILCMSKRKVSNYYLGK